MRRLKNGTIRFIELVFIFVGAIIVLVLSGRFDLFERFHDFAWRHEDFELDEIIMVGVYLAFAFLGFALHRIFELRQRERQLAASNEEIRRNLEEKYLLLREVNHRIKNNIASIEAFLCLQRSRAPSEECRTALDDAVSRVHSMASLYEKLVRSDQYGSLSLKAYLEDLVPQIVASYPRGDETALELDIDEIELNVDLAIPIGTMVNELVANSMKYGRDDDGLKIYVSLSCDRDKATLTVRDNGRGFGSGTEGEQVQAKASTGLGITIVRSLAQQIDGNIKMRNASGAETVIEFPRPVALPPGNTE